MNIKLNEQTEWRKEVVFESEAAGTATCGEMPWALPFALGRGRADTDVHQADEETGGRHSLGCGSLCLERT
jgi:hypothetical protein